MLQWLACQGGVDVGCSSLTHGRQDGATVHSVGNYRPPAHTQASKRRWTLSQSHKGNTTMPGNFS